MVRLYGRGKLGLRVKDYVPDARWKSFSVLSSLRCDGQTEAIVYEKGLTGDLFKSWLKEYFVKTLHEGDIVVMDNMSSHKVCGVKELIEAVGAQIKYLPPYSPDLNPIENMWSKVKNELRKASEVTPEQLMEATGIALNKVTQSDARGWFEHCGYSS